MEPFIEKLEIDNARKFSPLSSLYKKKKVTSDHFPLLLTFSSVFSNGEKTNNTEKPVTYTMWNTNKPGGWSKYKEITENHSIFRGIFNDNFKSMGQQDRGRSTVIMNNLDKVMTKINFQAFGKVKRKQSNENPFLNGLCLENIFCEQNQNIKKEFSRINNIKNSKGQAAMTFDIFKSITGRKRLPVI